MKLDPAGVRLAMLLGGWFGAAGVVPTRGHITIALQEIAQLPDPATEADVVACMDRVAARLGIASPMGGGS